MYIQVCDKDTTEVADTLKNRLRRILKTKRPDKINEKREDFERNRTRTNQCTDDIL